MFMIGMQNKNSQLKTKGFVLAEAIFSLFVTMLVLFILQNLLLSVKKANLSENQHMNEVAYAYVQLDRYMYDEDTKMVYPLVNEGKAKSATFVKVNKDKSEVEYKIEYYLSKRVLKVSKSNGGGYMPNLLLEKIRLSFALMSTTRENLIQSFNLMKNQMRIGMLERIKKKTKVKGSALFSSILVLITTLLFIKMYQDIYQTSMENNILLIKYLSN